MSLRERKKQRTAAEIHGCARRLVAERGLAGVTVDQICEAAGISPRTFFNYFPSKGSAVLGIPELEITAEQRSRFLAGHRPLVVDLCRLLAETIDRVQAPSHDRDAVKRLIAKDPELGFEMFSLMRDMHRSLRLLAEQRAAPGEARMAVTLVEAGFANAFGPACGNPDGTLEERLLAAVTALGRLGATAAAEDSATADQAQW